MPDIDIYYTGDDKSKMLIVDYLHDLAMRIVDGEILPEQIKTTTEYYEYTSGIYGKTIRIPDIEEFTLRFKIVECEEWEVLVLG